MYRTLSTQGLVYINLFNIICCPLFNDINKMPALCVWGQEVVMIMVARESITPHEA